MRAVLLTILVLMSGGAHAAEPGCPRDQPMDKPEWLANCNAAIAAEQDPRRLADLLLGRAYFAVEQYRYDDALVDLDEALKQYPDCAGCLHERGYVHGEMGNYALAIADLDREIRITPQSASAYGERAYARKYSGDLAGAHADRVRELEMQPDSLDALLARGEAAMWLGRFDEAVKDTKRAQSAAKKAGDRQTRERASQQLEDIQLWRTTSKGQGSGERCVIRESLDASGPRTLIGDCTRAFLEATNGAAKAEALTTRSTAWLVLMESPDRAATDLRIAAGLDPANHARYINLGFAYITVRHSTAAKHEFDRALALQRSWLALAGRASARKNMGDLQGAEEDATTSMELEPNLAAAWVLGELAYESGDRERAKSMYLIAYRLGSRDDRLMERFKQLGVTDPEAKAP
jgi:tetratricopeptide (TPR) repeat protein